MIIKRKHTGSFAVIPNITANDLHLKADTLGVLVYLLAKPADWSVSIADLRKRFGIGRDRVYAILLELEKTGYIGRVQSRSAQRRASASFISPTASFRISGSRRRLGATSSCRRR